MDGAVREGCNRKHFTEMSVYPHPTPTPIVPTPTPPYTPNWQKQGVMMPYVKIRDDSLWASHIEGDNALRERIVRLPAGASIELEVDGIVGQWEKAKIGKDGRPTSAIKPVGPMRDIWKRFQVRRGEIVAIRETRTADSYLAALRRTLSEWDSPEDNEAYRDL